MQYQIKPDNWWIPLSVLLKVETMVMDVGLVPNQESLIHFPVPYHVCWCMIYIDL